MKSTDKQTDNWIKQNGMDAKSFNATDIELLQAKKMAHSLLKDYANLLGQNEAATAKTRANCNATEGCIA